MKYFFPTKVLVLRGVFECVFLVLSCMIWDTDMPATQVAEMYFLFLPIWGFIKGSGFIRWANISLKKKIWLQEIF